VLTPSSFRSTLKGLKGDDRLFVDFTPFASFQKVFEAMELQTTDHPSSVTWATLDCFEYMSFCMNPMELEAWTGLRLYHAGDSPTAKGHIEVPIAAFSAVDDEANIQRLSSLVNSGGRSAAESISEEWADEAERLWNDNHDVEAEEKAPPGNFVSVTDQNWERIVSRVHREPGTQVLLLYTGSLRTCETEHDVLLSAVKSLAQGERDKVTLALVHCDLHPKPCDAASLAQYCLIAQHVAQNTCSSGFGPKGTAIYTDSVDKASVMAAIRAKLPGTLVNQEPVDREEL